MAYNAEQGENRNIVVYDLGGGTFDVSIVSVENGIVEVKASHGDTQLGGDDFDDCFVNHVCDAFSTQHGVNLRDDLRAVRRLKIDLEKAKCALSNQPFVSVKEEFIHDGLHLDIEISRGDYEDAMDHALKSWELKNHPSSARVGLLASLVLGETDAASSWAASLARARF
ncbi:MAG: Hsp70 family protein [Verrucomicrobiales bacterium]